MLDKMKIQTKIIAVIGSVVLVSIATLAIYNTISTRNLSLKLSEDVMSKEVYYQSERVYSTFVTTAARLQGLGRTINAILTYQDDRNAYEKIIKNYLEQVDKKMVIAIGLGFEEGVLPGKRFSIYASYDSQGKPLPTREYLDDFNENYYTVPFQTDKPYLTPVYVFTLDNGEKIDMITYSYPLHKNGKVVGVISLDMHLNIMQNFIKDIFVLGVGELTLIDNNGVVIGTSIYGMNPEDVKSKYIGKNIKDIGWWQDLNLIKNMKDNQDLNIVRISPLDNKANMNFFHPIEMAPGTRWGIMVQVPMSIITKASDNMRNISIIVSVAIIGFLIFIIMRLTSSIIVKPIKYAVGEMETIAKGDLTKDLSSKYLKRKDEIGSLINSFDKMKKELNDIVKNINESAGQIENAAREVSLGNDDLAKRTESQAASLEETASSMEEMASTIKASATNSIQGNEKMKDSKKFVESAVSVIETTTKTIEEVSEASYKISDITKMIESIALQTNILALNAAVEAARAGEQGRGFAVVASEVRNLAQTTQVSIKDITNLIVDVDEKIKKATDSVHSSKNIFDDIQKRITETVELMEDISSTAVEQQSGVEQINKAITDMDIATQQNAALVEEASAASKSLKEQAGNLVEVISFFKVTDN